MSLLFFIKKKMWTLDFNWQTKKRIREAVAAKRMRETDQKEQMKIKKKKLKEEKRMVSEK